MKILNIHQREFDSKEEMAGALLDSLSSSNDRLWPNRRWPAMKFDRPLQIGARGGHGPVRYEVAEYVPGKKVCFQFNATKGPCVGLLGHHQWDVTRSESGKVLLKHTLKGNCNGSMTIRWILIFRPLHDALIEDALDRAEVELTGLIRTPAKWKTWVIILRSLAKRISRKA